MEESLDTIIVEEGKGPGLIIKSLTWASGGLESLCTKTLRSNDEDSVLYRSAKATLRVLPKTINKIYISFLGGAPGCEIERMSARLKEKYQVDIPASTFVKYSAVNSFLQNSLGAVGLLTIIGISGPVGTIGWAYLGYKLIEAPVRYSLAHNNIANLGAMQIEAMYMVYRLVRDDREEITQAELQPFRISNPGWIRLPY